MKFFYIFLFTAIYSQQSYAQNTWMKPFTVNIAFGNTNKTGYVSPAYSGSQTIFAIEPQYAFSNNFSLGFRFGGALSFGSFYLLTGDYYLLKKHLFRPFFGIGLGQFGISSYPVIINRLGGIARIGFDAGHFRMSLEAGTCNSYYSSSYIDPNYPSQTYHSYGPNKYYGVTFGISIGGGPKNK